MDNTEITPIFQDDDAPAQPPQLPPTPLPAREPEIDRSALDDHHTPINQILEPQPSFYQQQPYYQPPAPPAAPVTPAGPQPKWDPFSNIGVTSWVVIAIAFIIGFVVGKLR